VLLLDNLVSIEQTIAANGAHSKIAHESQVEQATVSFRLTHPKSYEAYASALRCMHF